MLNDFMRVQARTVRPQFIHQSLFFFINETYTIDYNGRIRVVILIELTSNMRQEDAGLGEPEHVVRQGLQLVSWKPWNGRLELLFNAQKPYSTPISSDFFRFRPISRAAPDLDAKKS